MFGMSVRGKRGFILMTGAALVLLFFGGCAGSVQQTASTTSSRSPASFRAPSFGQSGIVATVGSVVVSDTVKSYATPPTIPMLRIKEQPVTAENLNALADRLGLATAGRTVQDLTAEDGTWRLLLPRRDDTVPFLLSQPTTISRVLQQLDEGAEIVSPTPEAARKTADEFLARIKSTDALAYQSYDFSTYRRSGGGLPEVAVNVTVVVTYEPSIGGIPILGPGAKVRVTVGPGDTVVGFDHFLEEAQPEKQVAVRTIADALTDLKDGKGQSPTRFSPDSYKAVSVESVRLVYYAAPLPMADIYYRPVFAFGVRGADGQAGDWLVPAYEGTVTGM
jgi:hypothetical protein